MTKWNRLALTAPPEISALGNTVRSGIDTVKTSMQALKALLEVAMALQTDPSKSTVQLTNAAIQALVSALNDAIDALLDDAGIYVLTVPLPKKGIVPLALDLTAGDAGSNYLQFPLKAVLGGLSEAESKKLQASSSWDQITNSDYAFLGGNAHFLRTLIESVTDSKDVNRPKFERSDTWAYTLLVAGSPDVTALGEVLSFLDKTFSRQTSNTAARGVTSIVPQNPRISLSGRGLHAVLEWDQVSVSKLLQSYDNSSLVATEYAIIRSTDFRSKGALDAKELFDDLMLKKGMSGRFSSEVVHVAPFDGITSSWVDTADLKTDTTYYYHVAFRGELRSGPDQDYAQVTKVPYGPLSRGMEIARNARAASPATRGQLPDWSRTPSLASFVPGIENLLDLVKEELKVLARASQGFSDRNTQYLQFLQTEINRYTTKANAVVSYVDAITKALTVPNNGPAISTKVGSGKGPLSLFLAKVIQDFEDTSDDNRPQFISGTEYVVGTVILCVGPDPARVQAALALFETIFGSGDSDNAVLEGVRSIVTTTVNVSNDVDAQLREIQGQIDKLNAPKAFDATMTETDSGDAACAAPALETPSDFNDDFTISGE